MASMLNAEEKPCADIQAFGFCRYDADDCWYNHDTGNKFASQYFVATVKCLTEERNECNMKYKVKIERYIEGSPMNETYYLQNKWHCNGAKKDDFVIFQSSKKPPLSEKNIPLGRVVAVLSKSQFDPINMLLLSEVKVKEKLVEAFTVDQNGTRVFDDAISVTKCRKKKVQCSEIGIHVVVAPKFESIPCYQERQTKSNDMRGFAKNEVKMALSFYVHTTDHNFTKEKDDITPTLTPVSITDQFAFDEFYKKTPFQRQLNIFLQGYAGKNFLHDRALYQHCYPSSWKARLVVDALMTRYNELAKEVIPKDHLGITKTKTKYPEKDYQEILFLNDCYSKAKSVLNNSVEDDDMVAFVAAGKNFLHPLSALENDDRKYRRQVKSVNQVKLKSSQASSSLNPSDEDSIDITSPLTKFYQRINQKILIHALSNPNDKIYTENQLLGMLCIRFKNPTLSKAIISGMDENSFKVQYIDIHHVAEINQLFFDDFGRIDKDGNLEDGLKKTLILDSISCEEKLYYNKKYVSIERRTYDKIIAKWIGDEETDTVLEQFESGNHEKTKPVYPFVRDGNNTKMTIKSNIRLEIQISLDDVMRKNGVGLRLLCIGKNRHLCLMHIVSPDMAFISDLVDVHKFNLAPKIEYLRKLRESGKRPLTMRLEDIVIEWNEEYYSGGSFQTQESTKCEIGDFLCIRKDVMENENLIKYVWSAHGVICECSDKKFKFSVCTLSQTDNIHGKKGFSVEIIPTSQKERNDTEDAS